MINTGIPTGEDVRSVFPCMERIQKGPVAVIECFQRIPCNPCQKACTRGAIKPFADISDLPVIDSDKCNGCGMCISRCPGLAIMVIDYNYSADKALLKLPYELAPLPEEGSAVTALNRAGEPVCEAHVIKVQNTAVMDKTAVVSLIIPKEHIRDIRHFTAAYEKRDDEHAVSGDVDEDMSVICRCSDLDINQIREYIKQGFTTIDEIKRVARLGMGPCQGRNCIPLVLAELSRATGKAIAELNPGTYRPATRSVSLGAIADYSELEASDVNE